MLQARLSQTTIERRVSPADVNVLREFIRSTVYVDDKILEYIVRLGRATRDPGERRPRRPARDAAARHLAALLPAPAGARPRHRVPARPHLGAARGREGDLLRRDPPPHRAHASARRPRTSTPTRSCRSCSRRCRSHDPRARHEGASLHRGLHGAEDPQPARRRLPEPAARPRLRLRRAPAVPARATTSGGSTGT